MLWPRSSIRPACFWPTIREMTRLTRSRSAVKTVVWRAKAGHRRTIVRRRERRSMKAWVAPPWQSPAAPPSADVRFVDGNDDQPTAAGRRFVRAGNFVRAAAWRQCPVGAAAERHPLAGDHLCVGAAVRCGPISPPGVRLGDRFAVDRRRPSRRATSRRPSDCEGRLRRLLRLRRARSRVTAQKMPDTAQHHTRSARWSARRRGGFVPCRARSRSRCLLSTCAPNQTRPTRPT